eukprot:m.131634 g.131634  ORF g.131634 m.131634 type:complete len:57 (+) comp14630_c0_seq2:1042-1212(+)
MFVWCGQTVTIKKNGYNFSIKEKRNNEDIPRSLSCSTSAINLSSLSLFPAISCEAI